MTSKKSKKKVQQLDEDLADLDITREDNYGTLDYLYPKRSIGALAYSTTPSPSNQHYVKIKN
jgi:hypothetical protein